MSFEDVGAALAAERKNRNLTVQDVANSLKISVNQLNAIESGDIRSLPHPAYAKGFIRSYASWLGIDQEEIQRMMELPKNSENEESQENHPHNRSSQNKKPFLWISALIILAAVIYYCWENNFFNLIDSRKEEIISTAPLATADTFMAAKDQELKQLENSKEVGSAPAIKKESEPAPSPIQATVKPEEENKISSDRQPETKIEEKPSLTKTQPSQSASSQHKLVITAVEECWVHSNADKTDTRQFSLRKGDTFALTFNDTLELKLGNAGGVRLRYDGEDLAAPGSSGQVKTMVFPLKSGI